MFTVSRTLAVNRGRLPDDPELTRAQVWRGLEMKAEYAVPFVESMAECRVVERGDGWLVREILLRGERMRERVDFEPMEHVTFERLESSAMGRILNEIVEEPDGELSLRFTFTLEIDGVAPGSDEERAFADRMSESYLTAVATTLATVRRLVDSGEL